MEADGCWVDYATVHYWYQTVPGGFEHAALRPVAERQRPMLNREIESADAQATDAD